MSVLGELYQPRGLALEQARAVLEVEAPYAVNVAWGCTNACKYCYVPKVGRTSRLSLGEIRFPKQDVVELVKRQLDRGLKPQGVFISFMTDPFIPQNREASERLIDFLLKRGVGVATSSKMGISEHSGVRHGMTIVSLNEDFYVEWEPNAAPPKARIVHLRRAHNRGDFTWVSMEPCPPPQIFEQDIEELLNEIKFVDLIIKGRWQYDKRASSEEAKRAYAKIFKEVDEFCEAHKIRFHPKSETVNFLKRRRKCE